MTDDLKALVAEAMAKYSGSDATIIEGATSESLERASGVVIGVTPNRSLALSFMDRGWGMIGCADGYVVHIHKDVQKLMRMAPSTPVEPYSKRRKSK